MPGSHNTTSSDLNLSERPPRGTGVKAALRPAGHQLTSVLPEWLEVNDNVMLLAAQGAIAAFQIVPVAGILGDPLDLVPAVGFSRELGNGALWENGVKGAKLTFENAAHGRAFPAS